MKNIIINHFVCLLQSDDAVNPDRLYDLVAVVIHCGSGPNRGHYISIVKSHGFWLLFDDDMVDVSFFLNLPSHGTIIGTRATVVILLGGFKDYSDNFFKNLQSFFFF